MSSKGSGAGLTVFFQKYSRGPKKFLMHSFHKFGDLIVYIPENDEKFGSPANLLICIINATIF